MILVCRGAVRGRYGSIHAENVALLAGLSREELVEAVASARALLSEETRAFLEERTRGDAGVGAGGGGSGGGGARAASAAAWGRGGGGGSEEEADSDGGGGGDAGMHNRMDAIMGGIRSEEDLFAATALLPAVERAKLAWTAPVAVAGGGGAGEGEGEIAPGDGDPERAPGQLRFDLLGAPIEGAAAEAAAAGDSALHHHGDEPARAGCVECV